MRTVRSSLRIKLTTLVAFGPAVLGLVTPLVWTHNADAYTYRKIVFPISGGASYSDTFGAPRSGGRTHQGQDLFRPKMTKLVSTVWGRVSWMKLDYGQLSGNMISIRGDDGYSYLYMHVNNDTPGTDDGKGGARYAWARGIKAGARVSAGQHIAYLGDSGNAEGTAPHLHFEIRSPSGSIVNPYGSLRLAQGVRIGDYCGGSSNPDKAPSSWSGRGYWTATARGHVYDKGSVGNHGGASATAISGQITDIASTRTGRGYWLVTSTGRVRAYGDAVKHGSLSSYTMKSPIVAMAANPVGTGYWLVTRSGKVRAFGNAHNAGSVNYPNLNSVVDIAAHPSGKGYWITTYTGRVFAIGSATKYGSLTKKATVVDITAHPSGRGYWLLTNRGAVYDFGDAQWFGSTKTSGLCLTPNTTSIVASKTGRGYWIQSTTGKVYSFGDARNYGHVSKVPPSKVASLAVAPPKY